MRQKKKPVSVLQFLCEREGRLDRLSLLALQAMSDPSDEGAPRADEPGAPAL